MTKKEAIENHRKMWNWIADETEKQKKFISKSDYFDHTNESNVSNLCYCCEYASNQCVGSGDNVCPIKWSDNPNSDDCVSYESLYVKWIQALGWQDAAKYARGIANLPERPSQK